MRQVCALPFPADADDIEARLPVLQLVARQVVESGSGNLPLLPGIDGCQWITEGCAGVRAHLDEDQRVAIERNQIDLAEGGTIILGNNSITLRREKFLGFTLSLLTEITPPLTSTHARRVAESTLVDQGHGRAHRQYGGMFR